MRTIKFRGYNAKNKEWLYGCYLINRGEHFIFPDGIQPADKTWEDFQIDPDTLGQFTGLTDADGNEIYEGDIICAGEMGYCEVIYTGYGWGFLTIKDKARNRLAYRTFEAWHRYIECGIIIGNIHDNPELMKGGEE